MTKYIGVDIGKKSHVACVLNETNKLSKRLKFSSTKEGYDKFKSFLTENSCTTSGGGSGDCIIGLEATGHYWFTLFEKLKADQFEVFVLNPLQVQSFRNESIRGSKTDELDCQLIAKVLKFGVGHSSVLPNEQLFELKELSRFRSDLIQRISSVKLKIMTVLDITFPEYETVFSDMFRVTSLSILKDYSPEEIAGLDVEKLTQRLEKSSKKLLGKKQAEDLKQKASNSFGLKYGLDAFSLELKLLLSEIEHLRAQVKLLDKRIKQLVLSQRTQLLSIPGISHKLAGTILGELVSFEKIQGDPRSLLAFAGMDPKIKQSGIYTGQTKMSKRGSPYLREAIYLASQVAYHTDPMFKRIYDKHKGQGKAHPVAISHVAKKMTYVIALVLRTGRKYQPEMNQG